ncbi:hypothetical protein J3F83DRAFT_216276 [Trichoderma novae-zelandiae]
MGISLTVLGLSSSCLALPSSGSSARSGRPCQPLRVHQGRSGVLWQCQQVTDSFRRLAVCIALQIEFIQSLCPPSHVFRGKTLR